MAMRAGAAIAYQDEGRVVPFVPEPGVDAPDAASIKAGRQGQINNWWYQAREVAGPNRYQMAVDCDYYDGHQWTEEEAQELRARGQEPTVYNIVAGAVDWLRGTERRTRVDWKILPRKEGEEFNLDARLKTELMKHISDREGIPWERSQAFGDACRAGVGWLEVAVTFENGSPRVVYRREHWRNVWTDPMSTRPDYSDARYLFRAKVVDLDVACALLPEHKDALIRAAEIREGYPHADDDGFEAIALYHQEGTAPYRPTSNALAWNHGRRTGVRLVECWYKAPIKRKRMAGLTAFPYQEYDPKNPDMRQEVEQGLAEFYDTTETEVRCALMLENGTAGEHSCRILSDEPSVYKHGRFPLVPIFAYRQDRDGQPYGAIRRVRDPQNDLNKRISKAQWILASNRVVYDSDAFEDEMDEDDVAAEAARPDAVFRVRPERRFEIHSDNQLAAQHIDLANLDRDFVREVGGITAENLGLDSRAQSGKAIIAKQEQGGLTTASLFDNLRLAIKLSGEIVLSCIEQFYSDEMEIRITGRRGRSDFQKVNAPGMPNLTDIQADFVVAEEDFRESTRLAMFEAMIDMVGQMGPDMGLQVMDLVLEMSDLPDPQKSEFVRRIRKITGQTDPDEETDEIRAQREQAEAEAAARDAELMDRAQNAEVEKLEAEAQKERVGAGAAYLQAVASAAQHLPTLAQAPALADAAVGMIEEGAMRPLAPPPGSEMPAIPDDEAPIQPMIQDEAMA